MMEQMCQSYCTDAECSCDEAEKDCKCFVVTNKRVPLRVNELQKMTMRLYFPSSTSNADLKTNMRMRELRTLWLNSNDLVLARNAKLLKAKTEHWAEDADDALEKLANILGLNIVHPDHQISNEAEMMFAESDSDEESLSASFSNISAQSQPRFNVEDSSIASEIKKFLTQNPAHFASCE